MRKILCAAVLLMAVSLAFAQYRNADKPLKGEWNFQKQKDWEIDGVGDDAFAEIRDIISTGSGRIYVGDSRHIKIYILNKDGKLISSFGKAGEGPGEFRTFPMDSQLHLLNNYLIVTESNRIHYFTLDGQFVKTVTLPNIMDPRAFISEDIFISAPAVIMDPSSKKTEIKLYNIEEKSDKIIASYQPFDRAVQRQETSEQRMVIAIVLAGITPMMMVEYRNGKIYYGMSNQYKIDMVDLSGKKLGGLYVENRKQHPVSEEYKKGLLKRLSSRGNAPESMLKNIVDGLPKNASYFENIVVDKNGLIYVFVSNPGENTRRDIDIFSPQGKYLYSSVIECADDLVIRRIYLKDELLILAIEDDEGTIKLAKYSIKIPTL